LFASLSAFDVQPRAQRGTNIFVISTGGALACGATRQVCEPRYAALSCEFA
jgi:hypothetical protein